MAKAEAAVEVGRAAGGYGDESDPLPPGSFGWWRWLWRVTWLLGVVKERERPGYHTTPKSERPRCGAKRRDGGRCQARAVWDDENNRPRNGRCRMHGGLSTGPKGKRRVVDETSAEISAAGTPEPPRAWLPPSLGQEEFRALDLAAAQGLIGLFERKAGDEWAQLEMATLILTRGWGWP